MISPAHRRRLNRALHELRRPLQTLALLDEAAGPPAASAPGAGRRGLLELAGSALAELDRIVNGGAPERELREVSCRELVLASLERWRPAAAKAGGIRVFWDAGPARVEGDPIGMAQALDNLIGNALEHGGPPLVLTGAEVAGRLRITIANGGPPDASRNGARPRDRDPRHGHGVSVVADVAATHSGRFALCETASGCVAALELPLAEPGLARAA